ncbi:multidrug efflux system protein MdtL [bacterium BMS3Abin02]|nr:multidrug efflux system protein MdtL [bacterium BMS3Abin02]HDL49547.1 MFS transporter [Actinomycetota bacterium]
MDTWTPTRSSTISWVLYDLANTIFALAVGSRYFSVWVVRDQGATDAHFGYATAIAMVIVITLAPWIGARSDHVGRRKPALIVATIVTVGATALLTTVGLYPSLALYIVGQIGFTLGSVVYDAMLPDVSTEQNRGRVSGLGVGVGYVGSFIAIGTGMIMLEKFGYGPLFRTLAALFLLFALPAFFFVKERPRARRDDQPPRFIDSLQHLIHAWQRARQFPGVTRFLIGRFLYADAANTAFLFVSIFAITEMGFTDRQTDLLALAAIVSAVLGSLLAGRIVDVIGPRKVLHGAIYTWSAAVAVAVFAATSGHTSFGWLVGVLGGAAAGATWTSDRVYMARLSPPEHYGEFYGLYATVGRFATLLGPLVWAFVTVTLGWGRVVAIATLLLFFASSRVILAGVTDR